MSSSNRSNARGFVFLTAVLMLGVVATALLALAEVAGTEARSTGMRASRAQLVQILLAGASDTQARLQAAAPQPGQTWDVELPDQLIGASLTANVESASADRAAVRISATSGRDHLDQIIQLEHEPQGWRIVSASLDPH